MGRPVYTYLGWTHVCHLSSLVPISDFALRASAWLVYVC